MKYYLNPKKVVENLLSHRNGFEENFETPLSICMPILKISQCIHTYCRGLVGGVLAY